jgi:hypothetical protein
VTTMWSSRTRILIGYERRGDQPDGRALVLSVTCNGGRGREERNAVANPNFLRRVCVVARSGSKRFAAPVDVVLCPLCSD